MNDEKKTMAETIPAARELRRVPGFDPMAFAREATAKDGKKYLVLDLKHKKTWFRLACPNGSMLLSVLQVNSGMAMVEAKVLADKDDRSPLASYVAIKSADKGTAIGGQHLRAAQDEALNEALDDAGFGLQLGDVIQVSGGSGYGSVIPLSDVETMRKAAAGQPGEAPDAGLKANTTPKADTVPKADAASKAGAATVKKSQPGPAPGQGTAPSPTENKAGAAAAGANQRPAPAGPQPHAPGFVPPAEQNAGASVQAADSNPAPTTENAQGSAPKADDTGTHSRGAVVDIGTGRPVEQNNGSGGGQAQAGPEAKPETEPQAGPAAVTEPAGDKPAETADSAPVTYTADMTVDEICERMTLEQAKSYVVKDGICKGWTMGQVASDRPSNLKWYQLVCPFADNILKASAKLVLQDLELKLAG